MQKRHQRKGNLLRELISWRGGGMKLKGGWLMTPLLYKDLTIPPEAYAVILNRSQRRN